jgi:hypothetical protein
LDDWVILGMKKIRHKCIHVKSGGNNDREDEGNHLRWFSLCNIDTIIFRSLSLFSVLSTCFVFKLSNFFKSPIDLVITGEQFLLPPALLKARDQHSWSPPLLHFYSSGKISLLLLG